MALALLLAPSVHAQMCENGQSASKPTPDAKLISSRVEGDTKVCRWLVPVNSPDKGNEFSVKYKVNVANLITDYDTNHKELVGLRNFMSALKADNHKHIKRLEITGYASPDGVHLANEKLADKRATDCCAYLKKEYDLADYPCTTNGIALPWSATENAIKASSIPMKNEVLTIVGSQVKPMEAEAELRAMKSAWDYLAQKILPPMRCVEINVIYTATEEVTTRCPIKKKTQAESPANPTLVENNYFIIMSRKDDSCLISYENPASMPLDYIGAKDRCNRAQLKKQYRNKYGRSRYIIKEKF